jgi:uncharacterized membrane protein
MDYHHSLVHPNDVMDCGSSFINERIAVRYFSIDLLRSTAILVMVFVHFCENLAGYTPVIAGMGAPMFMFLSGVSYSIWLNGQTNRGRTETGMTRVTIRRGLFLFGLGFVFNILVWSPQDVFNWDILTLIGVGLIALSFFRHVPLPAIVILSAALFLMAPIAQSLTDWPSYWNDGYFDPDFTISDVLLGFFVTGYFPVIPWLGFPLLGFVVATKVFQPVNQVEQRKSDPAGLVTLIAIGIGLLGTAGALTLIRSTAPKSLAEKLPEAWTAFPPSLEYIVGVMGLTVTVFVSTHWWLDRFLPGEKLKGLKNLTSTLGKYSLSIYLLHHLVHLWPLWIYGIAYGENYDDYWRKATSVPVAILLATLFLLTAFFLFRWIHRRDWPSIERLMRWLCDE